MRDNRGIDRDIGNTSRQLKALWDAINAMKSERRASATTIGSGGFTVDGGDVVMLDTDGSVLFRLGTQTQGDRGITISREDASLALGVRKVFANTAQVIEIRDADGYPVVAEEPLGNGLSRPILHIPMQPVQVTPSTLQAGPYGWQVPCTSGTFITTHQAWYARGNQYGSFRVRISASDTTTAAEVKVINALNGDHLGPFLAGGWTGVRAVGTVDFVEVVSPALFLPGNPDEHGVTIALQVRRTAGAGTLQVALTESHGS